MEKFADTVLHETWKVSPDTVTLFVVPLGPKPVVETDVLPELSVTVTALEALIASRAMFPLRSSMESGSAA